LVIEVESMIIDQIMQIKDVKQIVLAKIDIDGA